MWVTDFVKYSAISNKPQEIMLSPPRGSTKPLKINKKSKPKKSSDEPPKGKGKMEKTLEVPPPMTREPSQDMPSVLHTPTDELASSGPASTGPSASDGYMRTETDVVS